MIKRLILISIIALCLFSCAFSSDTEQEKPKDNGTKTETPTTQTPAGGNPPPSSGSTNQNPPSVQPVPPVTLGIFTDEEVPVSDEGVTGRGFKMYKHIMEDGGELLYLLKVPQEYETKTDQNWPVLLHLHAMGGGGQVEYLCGLFDMFWDIKRDLNNGDDAFIIIPRDYTNESAASLYLSLKNVFRMDRTRLYLTGMSMGGSGSFNVANYLYAHHGISFAAISRCSGNKLDDNIDYEGLSRNVIWMHVGGNDGTRGVVDGGPVYKSDFSYDQLKAVLVPQGAIETKELHVSPMARDTLGVTGPFVVEGESYNSYTVNLMDKPNWSSGIFEPLYAQVRTLSIAGKPRVIQSVYYYDCGHDAFAMRVNNYLSWLFSQRLEE